MTTPPCEFNLMENLREIANVRYCVVHNALAVECERDAALARVGLLTQGHIEDRERIGRLIGIVESTKAQRDDAVTGFIAMKAERDEARADLARLRQDLAFERTRWAGIGPKRGSGEDAKD